LGPKTKTRGKNQMNATQGKGKNTEAKNPLKTKQKNIWEGLKHRKRWGNDAPAKNSQGGRRFSVGKSQREVERKAMWESRKLNGLKSAKMRRKRTVGRGERGFL